MIYVDELRPPPFFAPRCFLKAGTFCHLMADADAELEDFAKRLGLNKAWRHGDHYDLTPARRARAVREGAAEVTSRDLVRIRRWSNSKAYVPRPAPTTVFAGLWRR